jgi:hypothetical protein
VKLFKHASKAELGPRFVDVVSIHPNNVPGPTRRGYTPATSGSCRQRSRIFSAWLAEVPGLNVTLAAYGKQVPAQVPITEMDE